jgi:hypothetical protein
MMKPPSSSSLTGFASSGGVRPLVRFQMVMRVSVYALTAFQSDASAGSTGKPAESMRRIGVEMRFSAT